MFLAIATLLAMVAAATAATVGFGIGSIIVPAVALQTGMQVAIAVVALPHLLATAQRCWALRADIDRRLMRRFGAASAAGALGGAVLHPFVPGRALAVIFGVLVVGAAAAELFGWMERLKLGRRAAWSAGALSGLFGGMVGEQGGLRVAALLAFDARKSSLVATSTAVGLVVDAVRLPVYAITHGDAIVEHWQLVALLTLGALAGTALGTRSLRVLPRRWFRPLASVLLGCLGGYMIVAGG